jgi:hypothetical protein
VQSTLRAAARQTEPVPFAKAGPGVLWQNTFSMCYAVACLLPENIAAMFGAVTEQITHG